MGENKERTSMESQMDRINYVELPVADTAVAKSFYEVAFGWLMSEFGPTYAATTTGDVDLGLQGDAAEATMAPLPGIDVEGLDVWAARGEAAGGSVGRAR